MDRYYDTLRVVRDQRLWLKFASFILVFLVFYSEARKIHSDSFAARYTDNFPYKEIRSLTKWIGLYTPEDSVFLSNFTATPDILYYGRRSIVTQPKYEDAESRKIIKDYISSLFAEGEEAFYGFCLNNNVDFYVFPKGTFNDRSLYSYWYMSGKTGEESALQIKAVFRFERDKSRLHILVSVTRTGNTLFTGSSRTSQKRYRCSFIDRAWLLCRKTSTA